MTTAQSVPIVFSPNVSAPPVSPPHGAATAVAFRRPRDDALPEHLHYRDDGCDLFAACLTCPLPRCRYDVPGGARTMLNRVRDHDIRRMRHEDGVAVDEIARRFRVSRRTVFRVLQSPKPASERAPQSLPVFAQRRAGERENGAGQ